MLNRKAFLTTTTAALAALAIAGCASQRPSSSGMPSAAPSSAGGEQVYTATLGASEEVPPSSSQGRGTAEVRVDPGSRQLRWTLNWSGLTGPATAAHIHGPAARGANAGVIVPFAGVSGGASGSAQGTGTLTQAQYDDLMGGRTYVNVHTAQHPGGEIRGQLMRR